MIRTFIALVVLSVAGTAAAQAVAPPTPEDLKTYTADIKGKGVLWATLHTSMGDIQCELFDDVAPMTVANFVGLATGKHKWLDPKTSAVADKPLYSGVICHRVIPEFMIQCGDPAGNGSGGPGYDFGDETRDNPEKHDRPGILSMANAGPGTNGSQFFVTEVPTPFLDGKHTVFGACKPLSVIKKIARVERGSNDRPNKDVVIKSIDITRKKSSMRKKMKEKAGKKPKEKPATP